jgi:hypothetical protein
MSVTSPNTSHQTTLTDLLRWRTIPSPDPKPASKLIRPATPSTPEPDDNFEEYIATIVKATVEESLKPYVEMISKLQAIIQEKDRRILELEGKFNDFTPTTTSRETNTSIGTHSTAAKIDELEQRARSWNLRLTGVAPDVEDTDKLVIDIAASISVKLNENDIDCPHYVGSTLQKRGRHLIVRLTRRNVSQTVQGK